MRRLNLYELNTAVTARRFAAGPDSGLSRIPAEYWQRLGAVGFDAVWLMGIWRRSTAARREALEHPDVRRDYDRALPGWTDDDVVGSPYAIGAYDIDPRFGTVTDLRQLRSQWRHLGLRLILDFVPNHLARDHSWVEDSPERFVRASDEALARAPELFFRTAAGDRLAHGKDPHFPPWTDTAQLNFFHPSTRHGLTEELLRIAELCDGVRCDMAMLALNDVFEGTWGWVNPGSRPSTEMWEDVTHAVRRRFPDFRFLAEAYWGLEPRLIELGFDYAYDRTLYDLLRSGDAGAIRRHLRRLGSGVERYVHFTENHDEERARTAFGDDRGRAALLAIATLPGATLLHDGQLDGRRIRLPVQLAREPDETPDSALRSMHEKILTSCAGPMADWTLLEATAAWSGNESHHNLLAWSWRRHGRLHLMTLNFSPSAAQGRVPLEPSSEGTVELRDALDGVLYRREPSELRQAGLYVDLQPWQGHLLTVEPASA